MKRTQYSIIRDSKLNLQRITTKMGNNFAGEDEINKYTLETETIYL